MHMGLFGAGHFGVGRYGARRYGAVAVCGGGGGNVTQQNA